ILAVMRTRLLAPITALGILAAPLSAQKPQLVVLLAVDQLRGDYYEHFKPQLQRGFARLYEHGAVFTEAYHDHAFTETAPGHATMLSGRFPVHTGIATNLQGVNTTANPLLGGGPADPGASPFRFNGTELIDWMRKADPATRFLSVSRKD